MTLELQIPIHEQNTQISITPHKSSRVAFESNEPSKLYKLSTNRLFTQ